MKAIKYQFDFTLLGLVLVKCHPHKKFTKEAHNIAFRKCLDATNYTYITIKVLPKICSQIYEA